jgi:hypothetical protein
MLSQAGATYEMETGIHCCSLRPGSGKLQQAVEYSTNPTESPPYFIQRSLKEKQIVFLKTIPVAHIVVGVFFI